MQSTYSWMGSPLHLVLEDEVADAFNRAQQAFFDAQKKIKEETGQEWNPLVNPQIVIDWTDEEMRVWNKIAELINLLIEINGGGLDITEEQITSDFLVKL